MERLDTLDRELGRRIREVTAGGRAARAGAVASNALGPAYRTVVALLLARRADRRVGLSAVLGGFGAAAIAGRLRDFIGRSRPDRADGPGFPSRHAAAATAIAVAVARRRPRLGRVLAAGAAVGLVGRVADGRHEPGDIAAGAALGAVVGAVVDRVVGGRR